MLNTDADRSSLWFAKQTMEYSSQWLVPFDGINGHSMDKTGVISHSGHIWAMPTTENQIVQVETVVELLKVTITLKNKC